MSRRQQSKTALQPNVEKDVALPLEPDSMQIVDGTLRREGDDLIVVSPDGQVIRH